MASSDGQKSSRLAGALGGGEVKAQGRGRAMIPAARGIGGFIFLLVTSVFLLQIHHTAIIVILFALLSIMLVTEKWELRQILILVSFIFFSEK